MVEHLPTVRFMCWIPYFLKRTVTCWGVLITPDGSRIFLGWPNVIPEISLSAERFHFK
jgi:hypothetical protein